MLTDHRALTLLPHWAHAVAHLGKRVENRKRPIPEALVGKRIAIHAGADVPREVGAAWARPGRVVGEKWCAELAAHANADTLDERWRWANDAICGRIVWHDFPCWVEDRKVLTRVILATAVIRPHDPQPGGWHLSAAAGDLHRPPRVPPWADVTASDWWALEDVIVLAEPVPVARGQLGLWRLDAATVDAVNAQGGGL